MAKNEDFPGEGPAGPGLPYATYKVWGENNAGADVWREIRAYGYPLDVKAGLIFYPEDNYSFYCVESGRLRTDFISGTGRQRSLLINETGSLINIAHAIHGTRCLEPYTVLKDGRLWRLNRCLVLEQPFPCPNLAVLCLKVLSSVTLTCQTALTWLDVDNFKIRFCRYLLLNIRRFGSSGFSLGLTQEECAQTLGVHRATLARIVKELKEERVLSSFTRDYVEIIDKDKLLAICGL